MKKKIYIYVPYIYLFLLLVVSVSLSISAVSLDSQAVQKKITNVQQTKPLSKTKEPVITATDSSKSVKALTKDIIKLLAKGHLDNSKYSVAVYSVTNNRFLFQKDATEPLTPASTTKFFTTLAALSTMGPNYLVRTQVFTDATNISNGIVDGNIYIVGHGDALLSIPDIEYLADQLKKNGIKAVKGNVYADGSYYDNETERLQYSGDKDIVQATQPITALSLEGNVATVLVSSGVSRKNINVQVIPASEAFKVSVKTRNAIPPSQTRRYRSNLMDMQKYIQLAFRNRPILYQRYGDASPNPAAPANNRSGLDVTTILQADGTQLFTISGSMEDRNSTKSFRHFILNPGLAVAGVLKGRLVSGGVNVMGSIGERKFIAPNGSQPKILAEFGRPILDILTPMNKNSDNYLAESMFKMVGAYSGKYPSTAKSAREVEKQVFQNLIGSSAANLVFNDGSGLSRRNQVSTEALSRLLAAASKQSYGKQLETLLPIAGVDGTLRNRMVGSAAENNLHAKTGTHSNVSALAGYVTTLDGEKLAFAFMFNGPSVGTYKYVEDELGRLLAQFFYFNEEQ